jgi:hypothetical protein
MYFLKFSKIHKIHLFLHLIMVFALFLRILKQIVTEYLKTGNTIFLNIGFPSFSTNIQITVLYTPPFPAPEYRIIKMFSPFC